MDSFIEENVKKYLCKMLGCGKSYKHKSSLTTHIRNKHDLNAIIYKCPIEGCASRFKTNSELKSHVLFKHTLDNEIKWFQCPKCNKKFKTNSELKQHIIYKHTSDNKIKWKLCTIENCISQFKTNGELKSHKSNIHNINTICHPCNVEDCTSRFKTNSSLKQHKQNIHNIDVSYYFCPQPRCNKKFKHKGNLKRHLSYIHDLGDKNCNFCKRNVYSLTNYQDNHGKHKICRKCYNKATGKNSRAETQMSNYLDEHIGTEFLLGTDKSLKSMGGCSLKRPDKLYASPDMIIHIECDEHQHKRSNTTYLCDEKRISDLYDEFPGKKYIVIRWNPDHYKPLGNKKRPIRLKRLELLAKLFLKVKSKSPENEITIYYMFYNADNPLIAKNIPYHLIQNKRDLDKLFGSSFQKT